MTRKREFIADASGTRTADGVKLANFSARIASERIHDSGNADVVRKFELVAKLGLGIDAQGR